MTGLPPSTKGELPNVKMYKFQPCLVSDNIQTVIEMIYNLLSNFAEKDSRE